MNKLCFFLLSILFVGCTQEQEPRIQEPQLTALDLAKQLQVETRTTYAYEEMGFSNQEMKQLSPQQRLLKLQEWDKHQRQVREQIGIPSRSTPSLAVEELHRRYARYFSGVGKNDRIMRSYYSQIMLKSHKVLSEGAEPFLSYYTNELIESGCDNPLLAEQCVSKLKGKIPDRKLYDFRTKVITKLEAVAFSPELLSKDTQIKEESLLAKERLKQL